MAHNNLVSNQQPDYSDSNDPQDSYGWVVMANLWAIDIGNVFVFMSIGILIPIWRDDIGLTPIQAGLMGSAGFLGFGLMSLPSSIWLTKYNPKFVTACATIGMALTALMHSISVNVEMLIISRFTFVALASSRLTIQIIFIQQWFQPRFYSIINGLDFSIRSIGQTLALVMIPSMILILGNWRNIYVAIALYMGILSILWVIFGKQNYSTSTNALPANQEGNPAGILIKKKILWVIASTQIGAACTFGSFMTFYPSYSMEHLNISVGTAGFLMSAFPIGGIIGSVSGGALSQKIGKRKPIIWVSGILLPIMYFILLNVDTIPLSMIILLMIGSLAMAFPPILFTIPLDMRLSAREVAVAGGLIRTLFPVGATMGPLIVGAIQESSGSLFLGLSVVAPLPITVAIASIFIPETGPRNKNTIPSSI